MKYLIALALGIVSSNAQTSCFGCVEANKTWCSGGSNANKCFDQVSPNGCNPRSDQTGTDEENFNFCYSLESNAYSAGENIEIGEGDMVVGTSDKSEKTVSYTVPSSEKSLGWTISSSLEGSSLWKFSNIENGVTIYEITGDSESKYTATAQASDELIYLQEQGSKMYVATSTADTDAGFEIIYQASYTLAFTAVSIAAVAVNVM